jgi:hypothetical protein
MIALVSAGGAQAAQAKQCITQAEVHGLIGYFLPSVLDTTIKSCATQSAGQSFFRTRAPQLVDELTPGRAAAWPMARSAFIKFSGDGDKTIAKMPDEVVKPFIEEAVNGIVSDKITTKNCKDIERILTPLAPLPGSNVVDLISEIFVVAARDDKQMPVCAQ